MGQTERIVLWVLLSITIIGLIVLTVVMASELSALNTQLRLHVEGAGALTGSESIPTLPTAAALSWGGSHQVGIAGVTVLTDSVTLTVTVRASGAGDLLFEPPVLESAEGQVYPVTANSLEAARMTFLDLVTRGEATARLEFAGRLTPTSALYLAFNPNQEPTNVVAPPLRVPLPLQAGTTP